MHRRCHPHYMRRQPTAFAEDGRKVGYNIRIKNLANATKNYLVSPCVSSLIFINPSGDIVWNACAPIKVIRVQCWLDYVWLYPPNHLELKIVGWVETMKCCPWSYLYWLKANSPQMGGLMPLKLSSVSWKVDGSQRGFIPRVLKLHRRNGAAETVAV